MSETTRSILTEKFIKRFWSKVDVRGPDECWPWKGVKHGPGYGAFHVFRKKVNAHRIAYMIHHGQTDPKLDVLHVCDNRLCQNPSHLFQGTHLDNMHDMIAKGRKRNGPWSP